MNGLFEHGDIVVYAICSALFATGAFLLAMTQ